MLIYEGNSNIENFNGMHNLDEYILRCFFNQDKNNAIFICPKELHQFLVEAFSELSYLKTSHPVIDKFDILEDDIYLSSVPSFHENNCFLIAFNHKKNTRSYFISELNIFETNPYCWMTDGKNQKKLDSFRILDNKLAYYNFISTIKLVDKLFERAMLKTKEVTINDNKVLTICDEAIETKIEQISKNKFDKSNYVQL